MILETRSLQLVLAIADHGTMTRAARHLHLTQSALSHHLLLLEGRLRLPLFHRMGRRMLPTPAGERVIQLARRVIPDLDRTEEALRAEAAGRAAVIRLSTECYTSYHWLPSILVPYREAFPGVEVEIVAEATSAPLEALLDSRLDLALVHSEPMPAGVRAFPLFTDELVLVTSPQHPLADRAHVLPDELRDEHLLTYARRAPEGVRAVCPFLLDAGMMPRRVSRMQLTEAIVEMVKADLGVSMLTRWTVQPHVDAGTVRAVRLGPDGLLRHWKAVVLDAQPQPHLRHFIRMLAQGPSVLLESAVPA